MNKSNKVTTQETPPVTFSTAKQGGGISKKSDTLLHLVALYRTDKEGLFWVLNQIKNIIQNEEASHLAAAVIERAKNV